MTGERHEAAARAVDAALREDRELHARCRRCIAALLGVVEGRPPPHTTADAVVEGARRLLVELTPAGEREPTHVTMAGGSSRGETDPTRGG